MGERLPSSIEKSEKPRGMTAISKTVSEEVMAENLAMDFLIRQGADEKGARECLESDGASDLKKLMFQMVDRYGDKLKIVKKPNFDRIYPVEAFVGNKNSYVKARGMIVFEVDGYQFIQKEMIAMQGLTFEIKLPESNPQLEIEHGILKTGFKILNEVDSKKFVANLDPSARELFDLFMESQKEHNVQSNKPGYQRIFTRRGGEVCVFEICEAPDGKGKVYWVKYSYSHRDGTGWLGSEVWGRTPEAAIDNAFVQVEHYSKEYD